MVHAYELDDNEVEIIMACLRGGIDYEKRRAAYRDTSIFDEDKEAAGTHRKKAEKFERALKVIEEGKL